jgi:predicted MFS family arabinose efflux permease
MIGSAVGPILGGTLVQYVGYEGLGYAAAVISAVAVLCFSRMDRGASAQASAPATTTPF